MRTSRALLVLLVASFLIPLLPPAATPAQAQAPLYLLPILDGTVNERRWDDGGGENEVGYTIRGTAFARALQRFVQENVSVGRQSLLAARVSPL